MISVIIPTYNESKSILSLIGTVKKELDAGNVGEYEILVMDDDSPDGTAAVVAGLNDPWVRVVNRRGKKRGLSAAVLDGFREARGDMLAVMDADGSHPPAALPPLVRALKDGALLAIGSRYVKGGAIEMWPLWRVAASRVACFLARPLTRVQDATSGFFALKREILDGVSLNPLGFKIGLEVFVKARHGDRFKEIPYAFSDRAEGESKFRPYIVYCYFKQLLLLTFGRK